MMKLNVKILVAAHKPYWIPKDDMYLPVHVGAVGRKSIQGYQRDDEGDNISQGNSRYCELTALYWAWKNLRAEYVGLVHYRRHFQGIGEREVLTANEAEHLLARAPVVLPRKRNYYIQSNEKHYVATMNPTHIDLLRAAITKMQPGYLDAFNRHMKETGGHIFNMFIMREDLLDGYCNWLFPLLFEVETHIDFIDMTPFQARCMGRLSELLLDVWLEGSGVPFVECPVVGLEKTNWFKKGGSFLAAMFFGKKYETSF